MRMKQASMVKKKKSHETFLDPGVDPDHPQNLVEGLLAH